MSNKIEPVEVERDTELCVWVRLYNRKTATRQNKDSTYESYRPTWESAREQLRRARQGDLDRARLQLQRAQAALGNVAGMKPPATESQSPA